ncbi:MAG: hypothetical protein QG626_600 [Patescibacteria group bacterium]|nr:hypothetical protein [Patescibacteria group bacterium]
MALTWSVRMFGRISEGDREHFKRGGSCLILDLDRYGEGQPAEVWWGQVEDLASGRQIKVAIHGGRFDRDPNSKRFVMSEEPVGVPFQGSHFVFPDTEAFRGMVLSPDLLAAHMRLVLATSIGFDASPPEITGIAYMT